MLEFTIGVEGLLIFYFEDTGSGGLFKNYRSSSSSNTFKNYLYLSFYFCYNFFLEDKSLFISGDVAWEGDVTWAGYDFFYVVLLVKDVFISGNFIIFILSLNPLDGDLEV